jgi:protein-disulfide isomerase
MTLPQPKPPILPVSIDDDPSVGRADAPITIVEFSDFQCPYCKLSAPVIRELVQQYPGQLKVVYRDYPGPNHPYAVQAAEAAQCAGDQHSFWEYHDLLFDRQVEESGWNFRALANELQLDAATFAACLESGRHREEVMKDLRDALKLGISSTPTFFVNGRPLVGARPVADFRALIDSFLPH